MTKVIDCLNQSKPKKKKIKLCFGIYNAELKNPDLRDIKETTANNPFLWAAIKRIGQQDNYDIILCSASEDFSKEKNRLFLGYWNDGVL